MTSGSERFQQAFNQMLRNKEHGSIAKYWRQRLSENLPNEEREKIFAAMEAESVEQLEPDVEDASPLWVFEDRSGLQYKPILDGAGKSVMHCVCFNAVSKRPST